MRGAIPFSTYFLRDIKPLYYLPQHIILRKKRKILPESTPKAAKRKKDLTFFLCVLVFLKLDAHEGSDG